MLTKASPSRRFSAAVSFCQLQTSDDAMDLVWLHPNHLLEVEGSCPDASHPNRPLVQAQYEGEDVSDILRQYADPISVSFLNEVQRDVVDPICHMGFPELKSTDTAAFLNTGVIEAHLAARHVVEHVLISWIY